MLQTPRLLLRTYREDDLPLFAALNADPAVCRLLSGVPLSREHSDGSLLGPRAATASEAAAARLDHAFGSVRLPRVISITDSANVRSLAVMRRLGMVFDHDAVIVDDGEVFNALVFSVSAEGWRERTSGVDRSDRRAGAPDTDH